MIIEERARSAAGFPSNDWDAKNAKKGILRPRFMSAADYVFYLRRHLVAERRRNDPTVGQPGDEAMSMGIPRLSFLLRRLEEDIQSSYLSFLEEFVSDIHEGIGCLLNILRTCQERQKGAGLFTYATFSRAKQNLMNKGAIDEFYCLLCLKACSKSTAAVEKMSSHKAGLSSVASCITSSHMKSRLVALELLTIVSRAPEFGNNRVLEAMTTIRILFGESVRFKFLVSILNSNVASTSGLETVTLVFLNTLLDRCSKLSDRVRIQSELEEAGLDVDYLEKQMRQKFGTGTHRIWGEIEKWRELQIDLKDALQKHQENLKLRKEVQLLREALKRLRDERKGIFNIHKQLKGQWNSMEQRLQDLALKSRAMSSPPSSSDDDCRTPRRPDIPQPDSHDSELDEILIGIPTIPAGSLLEVRHPVSAPGLRNPDAPPPLPPPNGYPKLSDSGISSNSAPDSELDASDWHYPDVPPPVRRINSVRVRFTDAAAGRRPPLGHPAGLNDLPPGTMILPPGQNKIRCADIMGIQNIPLPQRPVTDKSGQQHKKATKKRSLSSSRDKATSKDSRAGGRSFLPRSLQRDKSQQQPQHSTLSRSVPNLPPTDSVRYNGNNKLWNKKAQQQQQQPRPQSQLGSSLDGMIHREIAKAIRDRHALFDP